MGIKEWASLFAILFSFCSLLLSVYNYRQTRQDKSYEKRVVIINKLMEAYMLFLQTEQCMKNIEDNANKIIRDGSVSMEDVRKKASDIGNNITIIIDQMHPKNNKEELDYEAMLVAAQRLYSAVSTLYSEVKGDSERYTKLGEKYGR